MYGGLAAEQLNKRPFEKGNDYQENGRPNRSVNAQDY
jgi:hypothetical protein